MENHPVNPQQTDGPKTLSDRIIERLQAWGVDTIFGLPGDGVNGFVEALRKKQKEIRYVHVRHEEIGALAAVAYAKLTGRIGVCFGTTGPGAVHLLNGMLDAQMDGVPVLAITGLTYHDLLGSHNLQGADSNRMMEPFAVFNERIMGAAHVDGTVDRACRAAFAKRRPVHISIPVDFQSSPADDPESSKENVPGHSAARFHAPARLPEAEAIQAAANLLNAKKKVSILIGVGAQGAGEEIEQVAELLGAPVIKAMLGKDVISDDSPYTTGGTGHTTTVPSKKAMDDCEALLIVGSGMPYLKWYPKPGQADCVQIDDMPERIGLRYPVAVGLAGDAKATMRALIPMLQRNEDRSFLQEAQEGMKRWNEMMDKQGQKETLPMKPQVSAHHLSSLLANDAIVIGDAGTVAYWINKNLRMRRGQRFVISGTSCTMASGIAYGIGAQVAFPGRQVVVLTGDGSLTMSLGDLLTLAQYRLPVKLLVYKNNTLALERWEQLSYMANPEFGNDLLPADFVKIADGCGVHAIRIEDPKQCHAQLEGALQTEGPVLIECVVDPFEPALESPLPEEHAENYQKAFEKTEYLKEETQNGLRESLNELKEFATDSINEKTAQLLRTLQGKA